MSGDLVTRPVLASADIMSAEKYDNVERMAKALAASGQFKDITQWQQAFGRILLGSDMGLTPTQALMSIDVVRGNVQVRGKRLLAWIRESENYDYEIIERTPERGSIQFYERSKRTGEWVKVGPKPSDDPEAEPGPIVFTLAQAQEKGLVEPKSAWAKWPENMCLWRCASIGFNLFCPELSGGVAVYSEADVFESTAVELTSGEGDGSAGGWHGVDPEQAEKIEAIVATAQEVGLPGIADLGTVQIRLNGRDPAEIDEWIVNARKQLDALQHVAEAEVVDETK